jgi:hypothetical protein
MQGWDHQVTLKFGGRQISQRHTTGLYLYPMSMTTIREREREYCLDLHGLTNGTEGKGGGNYSCKVGIIR